MLAIAGISAVHGVGTVQEGLSLLTGKGTKKDASGVDQGANFAKHIYAYFDAEEAYDWVETGLAVFSIGAAVGKYRTAVNAAKKAVPIAKATQAAFVERVSKVAGKGRIARVKANATRIINRAIANVPIVQKAQRTELAKEIAKEYLWIYDKARQGRKWMYEKVAGTDRSTVAPGHYEFRAVPSATEPGAVIRCYGKRPVPAM
jgi:hypothetical protein